MKELIEAYAAAIAAISKRKTLTETRHALAAVERPYGRGTCYGYMPNTKAAFVEYCQLRIAELNNAGRVMCEIEAQDLALEINEAVEIAGRVIRAMKGGDIDSIMTGVRAGMYRSGLNDINALAVMALRIEINRAHREACEINAQVDSALMDLAVTIARLPEGADCGRHCINSLEFINKSYGVGIHPRMLAELVDRASK